MRHRLWSHRPLFVVPKRQARRLADVVQAMELVAEEKGKNAMIRYTLLARKMRQVYQCLLRQLEKVVEKAMEFSIGP